MNVAVAVPVPQPVLQALRPNDVLETQYRTGYRAGYAKARGFVKPRGLYANAEHIALVRGMVAHAFRPHLELRQLTLNLHLVLVPTYECDDDAWLFILKPTVDGIADAMEWKKDRRRFVNLAGSVCRDGTGRAAGLLVRCSEVE